MAYGMYGVDYGPNLWNFNMGPKTEKQMKPTVYGPFPQGQNPWEIMTPEVLKSPVAEEKPVASEETPNIPIPPSATNGISAGQAAGAGAGVGILKDMLIDEPRRKREAITNAQLTRYGGGPKFAPNTTSAWNSGLQGMMTGIGLQQRNQDRLAAEKSRELDNELRRKMTEAYAQQVMLGKKPGVL